MRDALTPKQIARAIGVSEASLKRWCDKGLLPCQRTAGGHRRVPMPIVMHFLRAAGQPLVHPEILGLPPTVGRGDGVLDRACTRLVEALIAGREACIRTILFDLYLAGRSAVEICDLAVAPAFRALGDRWQHGELEIYQERRACEMCLRAMLELRAAVRMPSEDAPLAIGGTLCGDPYALPTTMVEIALRENGWRTGSLGLGLPPETVCCAIRREQPALLWLSISTAEAADAFAEHVAGFSECCQRAGVAFVFGGRALREDVRRNLSCPGWCESLGQLVSFVRSIYTPPSCNGK